MLASNLLLHIFHHQFLFVILILTCDRVLATNPTVEPTTFKPTVIPSLKPTFKPSFFPSLKPTCLPSVHPSSQPTTEPSQPSSQPSSRPTVQPYSHPTLIPSLQPSAQPTQPTSQPSSLPSSMPSCGFGSKGNYTSCTPCPPGYSTFHHLDLECSQCPKGTFSNTFSADHCTVCPYPWTSVTEGTTRCDSINLDRGFNTSAAILSTLFFVVLLCIAVGRNKIPMMLNLVYPTLDVFSDIAYLMTNDFYNVPIFVLGILFLLFPVPCFLLTIRDEQAWPRLWWFDFYVGAETAYGGERIESYRDVQQNVSTANLSKLLRFEAHSVSTIIRVSVWLIVLPCQVAFLVCWLFLGMFFHMTKVITVGVVWNLWFRVWTGTDEHKTDVDIDTEELNKCLQHEFYFETLPQFILQLVNNVYLKALSPLAIFSLIQSVYTALNGCYKFIYYRYCIPDSKEMRDIPIDKSIAIKIKWLKIDYTLVNAKLEPKSKKKRPGDKRLNATAVVPHENGDEPVQNADFDLEMSLPQGGLSAKPGFGTYVLTPEEEEAARKYHLEELAEIERKLDKSFSFWLTDELRQLKVTAKCAKQCCAALLSVGINTQAKWAALSADDFRPSTLDEMGVTAKGLQKHLLHKHRMLLRLRQVNK